MFSSSHHTLANSVVVNQSLIAFHSDACSAGASIAVPNNRRLTAVQMALQEAPRDGADNAHPDDLTSLQLAEVRHPDAECKLPLL